MNVLSLIWRNKTVSSKSGTAFAEQEPHALNILIAGRGAVGSLYGWLLSRSGNNVTHLVRDNVNSEDATLEIDFVDRSKSLSNHIRETYHARCVTDLRMGKECDLAILPIQVQQVQQTLESLRDLPSTIVVVILTSVWEPLSNLDELVSPRTCIFGYPTVSAICADRVLHAVSKSRVVL
ncbi:MAG: hypothetical protein KC519_22820, partial [Anaerolineae bacterium]|nr:hypothetical protein [Anaerolineae bacterium]